MVVVVSNDEPSTYVLVAVTVIGLGAVFSILVGLALQPDAPDEPSAELSHECDWDEHDCRVSAHIDVPDDGYVLVYTDGVYYNARRLDTDTALGMPALPGATVTVEYHDPTRSVAGLEDDEEVVRILARYELPSNHVEDRRMAGESHD